LFILTLLGVKILWLKVISNQSNKEEASSKATSVPFNKTPPAPSEKTTTANFSEGRDGVFVGVAELGYDKFIGRSPKTNTSKNA
jgi:hypothetical protein